jgi:hypothetical protein
VVVERLHPGGVVSRRVFGIVTAGDEALLAEEHRHLRVGVGLLFLHLHLRLRVVTWA